MLTKTQIATFSVAAVMTAVATQPANAGSVNANGPAYSVSPVTKNIRTQVGIGKLGSLHPEPVHPVAAPKPVLSFKFNPTVIDKLKSLHPEPVRPVVGLKGVTGFKGLKGATGFKGLIDPMKNRGLIVPHEFKTAR